MILFVSIADTDILAVEHARELLPPDFPEVRCANPSVSGDPGAFIDDVVSGARAVIVRLLGGRQGWAEGFGLLADRCTADGISLFAFGGELEPDAQLARDSTVPGGAWAQAFEYLRHGGVANVANALRFVSDTALQTGFGFDPPADVAPCGIYRPELVDRHDPARPTVGIVFYRAHWMSGNTAFVDALVEAIEAAGANALPVYCYSLRPDADGTVAALRLVDGRVDALVVTVLASGGSTAGDALRGAGAQRPEGWLDWEVPDLAALDVPVIQGICATTPRDVWESSTPGLTPLDAAMQVAIPEFDGRVIGVPFSFKEPLEPSSPALVYRTDPERTRRLAEIAARLATLRRIPAPERRIAILLSSYPTKHARVGNAVGLDTPASAVHLLHALARAGYTVEDIPSDGDALIHSLLDAGGYDAEFLSDTQLRRAEARLDVRLYAEWFAELPEALRNEVRKHWGDPPGDLYVQDGALVLAGLRFGNVFVGIQPPRGFGENPIAIYHDPDIPPSHHYLAAYRWIEREFGAHGIVHLGKHGTLEWLPGKGLGLSEQCAPDAVLGSMPLVYPFIVNDPGEGTQAKRRAHAVIVDHLIPPMMRAETYDDLARLEQLLDSYAQVQSLDPGKLPELRARIWELVRTAELHRDLGVWTEPDAFDEFVLHLDGYLCEIKDSRIRDGLHVLGQPPEGQQRLGLLRAMLRLGAGRVPGLREAIASAFGLDERVLLAEPGALLTESPAKLLERFPGPGARASDVLDRLEEAALALLDEMEAGRWDPRAARAVCECSLGRTDDGVVASLELAARELIPRLERTTDEISNILAALDGRFVPSGPSGSPTRGLLNVLPTGRNFYSVDPKAIPSSLAFQTGQRLASDLLARYLRDNGSYPRSVGIVVWGTSAMRTQGDDVAEVLALLGVRPRWNDESRRIVGLEVVPLAELGRPRIDVVVRISGFFRDAFPNLIALLDEAVEMVASLDERDEDNFVARHAREALASGTDQRSATIRIFGSKPGAYGAGLLQLIDARTWRTDADLSRVYEVWGGYAYGRGLDGVEDLDAMRGCFSRIRVAVKNVDTFEHDLLDSDDYFQFHGGMVAFVRTLTGRDPSAYVADSSDPASVRTRTLGEEVRRVFRARVVNPRWIASMMRHGYKGAFELAATVDYLFGYDATAGVADDWMYEAIARSYVLDADVSDFLRRSNPWALRAITERLFEAAERGMWSEPSSETLDALRAAYLDVEGSLEDAPPGWSVETPSVGADA